jgi:hypothetical protein
MQGAMYIANNKFGDLFDPWTYYVEYILGQGLRVVEVAFDIVYAEDLIRKLTGVWTNVLLPLTVLRDSGNLDATTLHPYGKHLMSTLFFLSSHIVE